MSDMPWVRFFPSDWLGGTRGMSAAESGVYINLLAMMYERREPLPEDHAKLARLCGASGASFNKALDRLLADGKIIRKDGGLWNGRVEKEQVYRSEKSTVGKSAAEKRWRKTETNQQTPDASAMPTQCRGNANQKPESREDRSESLEKIIEVVPASAGASPSKYAFEATTIKLTDKHLSQWKSANPHVSVESALWAADEWAGDLTKQGRAWFPAVSNLLAKKEQEALERIHMARVHQEAGPRSVARDGRI